jgi:hypothetical protein
MKNPHRPLPQQAKIRALRSQREKTKQTLYFISAGRNSAHICGQSLHAKSACGGS